MEPNSGPRTVQISTTPSGYHCIFYFLPNKSQPHDQYSNHKDILLSRSRMNPFTRRKEYLKLPYLKGEYLIAV